jgi:hypothetical protein
MCASVDAMVAAADLRRAFRVRARPASGVRPTLRPERWGDDSVGIEPLGGGVASEVRNDHDVVDGGEHLTKASEGVQMQIHDRLQYDPATEDLFVLLVKDDSRSPEELGNDLLRIVRDS